MTWSEVYKSGFHTGGCKELGDDLCRDFIMKFEDNSCMNEFSPGTMSSFRPDQYCMVDKACERGEIDMPSLAGKNGNWIRRKRCKAGEDNMLKEKTMQELVDLANQHKVDLGVLTRLSYPTMTQSHSLMMFDAALEHMQTQGIVIRNSTYLSGEPPFTVASPCLTYAIGVDRRETYLSATYWFLNNPFCVKLIKRAEEKKKMKPCGRKRRMLKRSLLSLEWTGEKHLVKNAGHSCTG